MIVIPHAAVYLGCFTNTGIPEEDGARFRSDHCQNVAIFIPIHSHTAPSGSRRMAQKVEINSKDF